MPLTATQIRALLTALNDELRAANVIGEVGPAAAR